MPLALRGCTPALLLQMSLFYVRCAGRGMANRRLLGNKIKSKECSIAQNRYSSEIRSSMFSCPCGLPSLPFSGSLAAVMVVIVPRPRCASPVALCSVTSVTARTLTVLSVANMWLSLGSLCSECVFGPPILLSPCPYRELPSNVLVSLRANKGRSAAAASAQIPAACSTVVAMMNVSAGRTPEVTFRLPI